EVDGAIEDFAKGCEEELSSYCKDVTPGEGRILACLYAFEDKLSSRCEHALYDSMAKLSRTLTNFSYATGECAEDMVSLCSETVVGEGRVLDCLKQSKDKVSKQCFNALVEVGWLK
ncbi:MAG: cysteine rich repeat-containing protein, partial [Desulforhopalus sp.]